MKTFILARAANQPIHTPMSLYFHQHPRHSCVRHLHPKMLTGISFITSALPLARLPHDPIHLFKNKITPVVFNHHRNSTVGEGTEDFPEQENIHSLSVCIRIFHFASVFRIRNSNELMAIKVYILTILCHVFLI